MALSGSSLGVALSGSNGHTLGVAFGGCMCGGLSKLVLDKLCGGRRSEGGSGGGGGSASNASNPRFPYSKPGPGWRGSGAKAGANGKSNLGGVTLSDKPADMSVLGPLSKELKEQDFINTLGKLIGVSKYLQNNPRLKITPQEKKACQIVMDELRPYSTASGGPLQLEELEYVPGRPSLKVVYPGTDPSKTVSFVGSHFDVVPADPEVWNKDPFSLTVEGDKLYGRGTTDCLGHVALITRLLAELGRTRPPLKNSVIVVFIAAEEGGETGVGVDLVVKNGKCDECKGGPVYWVDSADSQPCIGTAGTMSWSLNAKGRLFHSGFPYKGINAIELVSDSMAAIQERFYDDFPPHQEELKYQFGCGSNMKPTQMECKKGGINQICDEATMHGDIRISPFYDVADIKAAIEKYVNDINDDIEKMPNRGPFSKYVLGPEVETQPGELKKGLLELKWNGDMETMRGYEGIACSLDSPGHKALVQAIRETNGEAKPFAVNGSLPLVRQMQKAGFDLQLCGFGHMSVYHGIDEYCSLKDMKAAYQVLLRILSLLEARA